MTESESDQRLKRKRKSKLEQDGKNFECKHCDKTYFSTIALNNHVKTKHGDLVDVIIRGRGRPRKYEEIVQASSVFDGLYASFFNSFERKKGVEEDYDFRTTTEECISSLYKDYNHIIKSIQSQKDYSFFENQDNSTDSHMIKYLKYVHTLACKDFFLIIVKFILLLRECINIKFGNLFTSSNKTSKFIPELVNEFLTDFMEVNEMFGMEFNQTLDLTQHFCHWLLVSDLTTSKLSLIN